MAAEIPDTFSLKSWQEAFQYPVPTVRRIEQELRRDAVSNREKLRSLVGVRYRDLLDTAQTIIEMNEQMQHVDRSLTEVGRNCNASAITHKSDGLRKVRDSKLEKVLTERTFDAQLTLLNNCASVISQVLRRYGSGIVAAKLLVISRLLHKDLSQSARAAPFVNQLRNRLAPQRNTLLKRIDLQLASINASVPDIIECLSAFCLATSSSAKDAFDHFQMIRLEAISSAIECGPDARCGILEGLKFYSDTLSKSVRILSGPLSEALRTMTTQPLLADPAIRAKSELGLDILQHLISKDIKNFTPWISLDELSKQFPEKAIKPWSQEAFERLVSQSKLKLSGCKDLQEILSVRSCVLEEWLARLNSVPCHDSMQVLEGIRSMINNQLLLNIRSQGEGLLPVAGGISSMLAQWSDTSDQDLSLSLWDTDFVFMDFMDGATDFKRGLLKRTQGEGSHISRILQNYTQWVLDMGCRSSLLLGLRNAKWEDILDDDIDEDMVDVINGSLTDEDPTLLQEKHANALLEGYKSLENSLMDTAKNMDGEHRSSQSACILRVVRAIRNNIPKEVASEGYIFARDLTSGLYGTLVEEIVPQNYSSSLIEPLHKFQSRCAGRSLWEGNPPLPLQSSQTPFRLLRELVLEMEILGPDLWNCEAVKNLKLRLTNQLMQENKEKLGKLLQPESEEHASENESEKREQEKTNRIDAVKDHKIQLLFDLLYLNDALSSPDLTPSDGLGPLILGLEQDLDLSPSSLGILRASAQQYWRRTQLLFGLLA